MTGLPILPTLAVLLLAVAPALSASGDTRIHDPSVIEAKGAFDMTTRSDETDSADHRLATYGTLSPGEPNHHQLAGLSGAWRAGSVRGRLAENGWGAALGYRGLTLDADGDRIAVQLFESKDLPDHWGHLDAFEGSDYRRVVARVETATGDVEAFLYVLAPRS